MPDLSESLQTSLNSLYIELDCLRNLLDNFCKKVEYTKDPYGNKIDIMNMGATELIQLAKFIVLSRRAE